MGSLLYAFFGFLRCSEFTTPSQQEYDPQVHLQYEDVAVDCRNNPGMLTVWIKQSKTDPFRQGVTLWLGKTDCVVCPVTGILPYLTARRSRPGPLFITSKGAYDKIIFSHSAVHTPCQSRPPIKTIQHSQLQNWGSYFCQSCTHIQCTHTSYGLVAKQCLSVIIKYGST